MASIENYKKDLELLKRDKKKYDQQCATAKINIANDFSKHLFKLVKLSEIKVKQSKKEKHIVQIDRLSRLIRACPTDDLFRRCRNKIWDKRKAIMDKNAEEFLNKNHCNPIFQE